MGTQLLVLGCSQRKTSAPEPTPALIRYDGPFYQDFRSYLRRNIWPTDLDIAVLSAKFGLIGALTEIKSYDVRMDKAVAREWAPRLSNQVYEWSRQYQKISFCLGKLYLDALPKEVLARDGRSEIFEGPIGLKRQRLGEFIRGLGQTPRATRPLRPVGRLTYFLPDWDDLLDPGFDFENDAFSGQKAQREERHCARLMRPRKIADGILVSLGQKREAKGPLRYVGGLSPETLRPINLRRHYGLDQTQALFGDCGAFSYVSEESPPFGVDYAVSLYDLYNLDYGASVDHIPVPFLSTSEGKRTLSDKERLDRVKLTTSNAQAFHDLCRRKRVGFTPVGTVQGLNARQYADNALAYAEMGYDYVALGGLVPMGDALIAEIVSKTVAALRCRRRAPSIHLFGVFRPKLQKYFRDLGVSSFDSATYFRKAWLRSDQNYLAINNSWYAAIRVPMTSDGRTRMQLLKSGADLVKLEALEADALCALHEYGQRRRSLKATLTAVIQYDTYLARSQDDGAAHRARYQRTLEDRPWEACPCPICRQAGIDVLIFRGANRNKRRGAHNTWRLYTLVKTDMNALTTDRLVEESG